MNSTTERRVGGKVAINSNPRPASAATTRVGSLSELKAMLEQRQRQVGEEIAAYPTPIAGCDVQFNALLECRRGIARELSALASIAAAGHDDRALVKRLGDFVSTSKYIESAAPSPGASH